MNLKKCYQLNESVVNFKKKEMDPKIKRMVKIAASTFF